MNVNPEPGSRLPVAYAPTPLSMFSRTLWLHFRPQISLGILPGQSASHCERLLFCVKPFFHIYAS